MTNNHTSGEHPDTSGIRALLASADPAASLTPLRSEDLHRLKEHAMTNDSNRPTAPAARPGAGANRRRWVAAGIGGLGVAAAAAVIVPNVIGADQPDGQPAGQSDGSGGAPAAATSTLSQPDAAGAGAPAAMCAEVTPEALAGYDTAFSAEVTSVEADVVTLAVTDRFTGDVEDTVTTTQGDGSGIDGAALVFNEGATYLISTQDHQIITCGVSGQQTAALDDIYRSAFTQ